MNVNTSGETGSFTVRLSTLLVSCVVVGVCVLERVIFVVESSDRRSSGSCPPKAFVRKKSLMEPTAECVAALASAPGASYSKETTQQSASASFQPPWPPL